MSDLPDIDSVKKSRTAVKGQITSHVNKLNKILEADEFDEKNINDIEIQDTYRKLRKHFQQFEQLHEQYTSLRKPKATDEEEEACVAAEIKYQEEVSDKVFKVTRLYNSKRIPSLKIEVEEAIKILTTSQNTAQEVCQCLSGVSEEEMLESSSILQQPAVSEKSKLEKMFSHYETLYKSLKSALDTSTKIKDEAQSKQILEGYSKHNNQVETLKSSLDKIIRIQNVKSSRKLSVDSPTLNSTLKEASAPSPIKLEKPSPIKFSGQPRDFASFRRKFEAIVVPNRAAADIGLYLQQAVPSKHEHLIRNIEPENHKEMMEVLANEFGTSKLIVDSVIAEMDKMKISTTDKMYIEFVEKVEAIYRDLKAVDKLDQVHNEHTISKLESRLPTVISQKWIDEVIDKKYKDVSSKEKFEALVEFLKSSKEKVKYNLSDNKISNGSKTQSQVCYVTGLATKVTPKKPKKGDGSNRQPKYDLKPCLACDDGATDEDVILHSVSTCDVWKALSYKEKLAKVRCKKHPFSQDHTTEECKTDIRPCRDCKEKTHHNLLCPKKKTIANSTQTKSMIGKNSSSPMLMQTTFVNTESGVRLGTYWDLGSSDNYITRKMATRLGLEGTEVEIEVEGIKRQTHVENTMLYHLVLKDIRGQEHAVQCYGLDRITSAGEKPDKKGYAKLCDRFGVKQSEVKKPSEIHLLLSMSCNNLHPVPIKTIDKMILYNGPFGKVFGGSCDFIKVNPMKLCHPTGVMEIDRHRLVAMKAIIKSSTCVSSAKADRELLDYFKEDSFGVHCEPKCGGCRCGSCAIGSKQMSLKDEKEYERFRNNMNYEPEGTASDPGPYWRTKYPWNIDRHKLIDNLPAVLGVMQATKRKLKKDPLWEQVYESQLKELIDKGFAREISEEEIEQWKAKGNKCYYIAHQMALNPSSKTTPVRVVFNSSQTYKGYSLNSSIDLGPDIMSNLQAVLLRFREHLYGASGDMTKMFYSVRVTLEEEMCQMFVWQFKGDTKIRTYGMTRLPMGNCPSTNISIVAVKETSELEDYRTRYPMAHKALNQNTYVDNVFHGADSKEELDNGINEIELVAAKGGFKFKEWTISYQKIPEKVIGIKLPNAIDPNIEKALGVFWDVEEDKFYVKPSFTEQDRELLSKFVSADYNTTGSSPGNLNTTCSSPGNFNTTGSISRINNTIGSFSGTEKKLRPCLGMIVKNNPKLKLNLRICLSFHSKPYDPLGFVLPTRMVGNILFRKTIQSLKKERQGKIPWDEDLGAELAREWIDYFEMLQQLEHVKFRRSIRPDNCDQDVLPILITFNDGNEDAFGSNAYALWTQLDGSKKTTLIMSKSKLAPLLQKGDSYRNELSSAVLAARLKAWIYEHSGLKFQEHIPFLDSKIVQAMIRKQSYGFNTFAGLRVGEIQNKTNVDEWCHVPSEENISDILTRGAPPSKLGEGSIWQDGPSWLIKDRSEWPVTKALDGFSADEVKNFCSKKKVTALVASVDKSAKVKDHLDELIENYSDLTNLIKTTAYILRWKFFKVVRSNMGASSKDGRTSHMDGKAITSVEYNDAWLWLIYQEQQKHLNLKSIKKLIPVAVEVKLAKYDISFKLQCLGGRTKNFPEGFSTNEIIPIIPYGSFAKLIVSFYHNKHHKEVDTIVTHVRSDVWVIKARKIAATLDGRCRICLERRHKCAGQVMGKLPLERSSLEYPAWSCVNMDLFGPLTIRDDCVKKGPRVQKKVWGVVYACTLTRGVYIDVAIDYSTESILHTIRRLLSNKGNVSLIISDAGSQLRGADKEMKDWRYGWNKEDLIRFGADKGLEWRFVMPNSQHQNGACEILIKLIKGVMKTFLKALGTTILSLNELNTLFLEVANLVNERPIGTKPNESTDPIYLSPNSLYLGRCSDRISSGPFQSKSSFFEDSQGFSTRFGLVQSITEQYWRMWQKLYFPTLIIQQKWHTEKRNMKIDDVCLLKDSDAFRGEWRICRVSNVFPDEKGIVRNVEVKVVPTQTGSKNYKPVKPNYLQRHVSNLLVLVPAEDQ